MRPTHIPGILLGGLTVMAVVTAATAEPAVQYRAIDLGPAAFPYSQVAGVSGTQQVGFGDVSSVYSPQAYYQSSLGSPHALLWNGTAATTTDLQPAGFSSSVAVSTTGTRQVGFGRAGDGMAHALMWSGTASSVVDLQPPNLAASTALAAAGDRQVGWGAAAYPAGQNPTHHAMVWNGTAASAVDVHPSGFRDSIANATTATQHVGYGTAADFIRHALLWSGTSSAAVDLNPTALSAEVNASVALGICGNQQVGFVGNGRFTDTVSHAVLWTGTAASAVDLHPPGPASSTGFVTTIAAATNGSQQVGYSVPAVFGGGKEHALLWSGTADSMVDLHQFLPPGFGSSGALGIDAAGNVVGWASPAVVNIGQDHAILWLPVPEPGGLALAALAAPARLTRRRARRVP